MTNIVEAKKLEPVAWRYRHVSTVGWSYSDSKHPREDLEQEPLVRLSDAQAALAAAEERGRVEERDSIREIDCLGADTLTHEMRKRMISDMNGLIEFLAENPDNIYHLDADNVQLLRDAITKEPTP